ncbi:MAG: hypothetical protein LBG22_10555 [Treponema sp.]|jgi:hypothetical protein|nr:hypothetical protein [Treponema sp.]
MAKDKKPSGNPGAEKNNASRPSIYSDRSTIGSADELDEYGVWVKSEPQDLSSAGQENSHQETEDSDDVDLSLPEEDLSLPEEDFAIDTEAAAEEESLSFDLPAEDSGDSMDFPSLDIPVEDTEEDISAEESSVEEEDLSGPELVDFGTLSEPMDEEHDSPLNESSFSPAEESSETDEGFSEVPISDFLGDAPETLEEPSADTDTGLSAETETGEKPQTRHTEAATDLSTRLLMKIAEELSSIRTELSTLKKEFTVLKSAAPAGEEQGGFFDEEEDEKIALTGDELDNILNTADFTEESGEDVTGTLDTEDLSGGPDEKTAGEEDFSLSEGEDILNENPESEETGTEKAGSGDLDISLDEGSGESFDNIDIDLDLSDSDLDELNGETRIETESEPFSFDEEDEPLTIDDLEEKDAAELKHLREEGALPITAAPEDTSYLEEDPLGITEESAESGEFGEISLDLSDAVIDEPDFAGEITENPVEEPSLDSISIDVDSTDFSVEESGEDITIEESVPEEESTPEEESVPAEEGLEESLNEESIAVEGFEEESLAEDGSEEIIIDLGEEENGAGESEEDLSRSIPEGFIVEADENPFDSSPETEMMEEESIEVSADDFNADDSGLAEEEFAVESGGAAGDEISFDTEAGPDTDEELSFGEETESEMEAGEDETEEKVPGGIKEELKTVLSYMDQLLESLPEEKIEEFARSEYFDTYKKLFKELGLV